MAHILLVDDNPEITRLYTTFLSEAGHDVETAANGREAVERLDDVEADTPELVLLDMEMPEMDGVTAARHLNDNPQRDQFQLIALTSHELPEQIDLALEAGCDGYIVKPNSADDLLEELHFVLLADS